VRFLRAVRARVPEESRAEYLDLLDRFAKLCDASPRVKGFYVMESAEARGDFLEYVEFADEAAADAFAEEVRADSGHRAIRERLRQIVPEELVDTSFWQQRI
jgi:hypothetical protein